MTKTKKTKTTKTKNTNDIFTEKDAEKMFQQIAQVTWGKTSYEEGMRRIMVEVMTRQFVLSLSKESSKKILHDLMWKMVDNYDFKKYSMKNFCSKILDNSSLMQETYIERGFE